MGEVIGHVSGTAAFVLAVWSFQLRGRRRLLLINVVVAILLALQFSLLGAFSGAASALATAVCSAVAASVPHGVTAPWRRYVLPGLMTVGVGLGAMAARAPLIEWLPVAAFALGRAAELSRSDRLVRTWLLPVSATWLLYAWIHDAWASVALETTMIVANAWGIYRLFHAPQATPDPAKAPAAGDVAELP